MKKCVFTSTSLPSMRVRRWSRMRASLLDSDGSSQMPGTATWELAILSLISDIFFSSASTDRIADCNPMSSNLRGLG